MKLADVGLVMAKELRETLRDRRTLAVLVLFPLVVYPLVSLLMAQVMASRVARTEAQASRVAVSGPAGVAQPVRARLTREGRVLVVSDAAQASAARAAVEDGSLDAAVEVLGGGGDAATGAGPAGVRIVYDETREPSSKARERVAQALEGQLMPGCRSAYSVDNLSLAPRARVGGYVLSKILPLVVVVMVMLGAFYPAIDITAGERERGTLETILSAPIARFDLMAGKVLAVAALAAVTGLLNITSMSLTVLEGVHLVGAKAALSIPWTRAAATLVVVIPTAFLFASVMVAVGAMARSFKEAQTLLTPVYFLCFTPSLIAGLGDYELGGASALLPGVNVTLLARDLVVGKATFATSALVVLSTLAYGAVALALAAGLYDSERLLSADDGNLRLGPWLRRLLLGAPRARAAESAAGVARESASESEHERASAAPTLGQAAALYGVALVLFFFVWSAVQKWRLVPGLLALQASLLGLVAIYARGAGRTLREVLVLRRPRAGAVVGAVLVGVSAWAVIGLPAEWLFPPPREAYEALRRTVVPDDGSRGLGATLLFMALAPALCEEALFRGPILRAFARPFSPLLASAVTGLLFGVFHLDIWRLVPASALGLVLSMIALRSGSIVPAMVTHFTNNASLIVLAHLGRDASDLPVRAKAAVFLGGCVVLAAGWLLVRRSAPRAAPSVVL